MGIGKMQRLQLVQYTSSQAADGRATETTGEIFGVWGEVQSLSGSRGYQNGQLQLDNTKRFTVRFRFDKYPDSNWNIRYRGMEYSISRIDRIAEKRFYWSITAMEKSNV